MRGEPETVDEDQKVDPSVEVSQWLREVGRRRWPSTRPQDVECNVPTPPEAVRRDTPVLRRTLLLALLLVVALHYVYADTAVRILSLRSLVVFAVPG